jgi:hypothetical protein
MGQKLLGWPHQACLPLLQTTENYRTAKRFSGGSETSHSQPPAFAAFSEVDARRSAGTGMQVDMQEMHVKSSPQCRGVCCLDSAKALLPGFNAWTIVRLFG